MSSVSNVICIAVYTHTIAELTRTAKVNDLDGTALGVTEQNVLRLEIAVYNLQFRSSEEQQRRAQLLRKLARQIERHPAVVCVAQQVVKVVRQQLKDEEQMITKHKMSLQLNYNTGTQNTVSIKPHYSRTM